MAFDFSHVAAPFRMQPGLRRLAPGTAQLTPAGPASAALQAKREVLAGGARQALCAEPGFDATPALDALMAQAVAEQPQAFSCHPCGGFAATQLGWRIDGERVEGDGDPGLGVLLRALPPFWRLAGLLSLAFEEDFAVVDAANGHVPWLAVCLPSGWAPEEKIGRSFTAIHAPVADNAPLLAAAPHLLHLVTAGERWERFVWTITDSARLDRHPRRCPAAAWHPTLGPHALADRAFLRSERQTFMPVAGVRQAVFTIRVRTEPLTQAVASADDARRLQAALASMSPAVLAYRGLAPARDRLLTWLEGRQRP